MLEPLDCYELLALLPREALLRLVRQGVLQELLAAGHELGLTYDPEAHEKAQQELYAFFARIENSRKLPEYLLPDGWPEFCSFFYSISVSGPASDV